MTYSLSDFIILMFFAAIAHPCANTKFMQTQNTSEVMKWSWQHTQNHSVSKISNSILSVMQLNMFV